jgi:hypothetical protein
MRAISREAAFFRLTARIDLVQHPANGLGQECLSINRVSLTLPSLPPHKIATKFSKPLFFGPYRHFGTSSADSPL